MPIVTSLKVRKLQRTLYQQAKGNVRWRAWSLYGELCREDVLQEAVRQVIRNGGGAGVDGMRARALRDQGLREKFLETLRRELLEHRYRPSPLRRVYIKKENGKVRALGIPTVKDRVVQTAALILLLPIFEADMHEQSYAYRPKRNPRQAVEAIKRAIISGRTEVLDADLSAYFDSIPQPRMMRLVAKRVSDGSVLGLIKSWLRAPVVEEVKKGTYRIQPTKRGTPQGGTISPLLGNLYLTELDQAVPRATGGQAIMVRYADDFVICCRPGRGKEIKARTAKWLTARGLKLNEEKTRLVDARRDPFSFVGFTLSWRVSHRTGRRYPHAEPSQKSQLKLRTKVRPWLMRWNSWQDTTEVIAEVNQMVQGWEGYFHYANSAAVFRRMNRWLCDRLRRWLCRKHRIRWGAYRHYPDQRLHDQYGLHRLPETASWKPASTVC